MRAVFSISDDDLAYAERVLLPVGESFDKERRDFIRNLDTLDLQAAPGSGKTTALLAKLLILDRYLPFADGSGVLVISHTNAAIDEIRSKIGDHCKALFRYPNFVGTIQSFVDEFLAVPCFTNRYKRCPIRIDDEIRDQIFGNRPFRMKGFSDEESRRALHFLRGNTKPIRWSFINGEMVLTGGYMGQPLTIKKPRGKTKPDKYRDWSESEKARVLKWVERFARRVLASGHLCYDDAYFLADVFISRNPQVKDLLQARFSYAFVDEMQDMEKHQHDLLERIFFDAGTAATAFQRIGDKNQAIYDKRSTGAKAFWNDRALSLQLNGSHRLSPALASLVSIFAVSPLRIDGRGKNPDGSKISIRPKFIVYSDSTIGEVIPHFASIIRKELDRGTIPIDSRNKYKAIAWVAKPDEGKIRLCNYHSGFSRDEQLQRPDHPNLETYLLSFDKRDRTFASIERSVTGAILRVLRIEGVIGLDGFPFNKRRLKTYLVDIAPEIWEAYEAKVYHWCVQAVSGNGRGAILEMQQYLPEFLAIFGANVSASMGFVNDTADESVQSPPVVLGRKDSANIIQSHGVEIQVSTIHAVKGETHAATLYMETHHEKGAGGSYESERLANQLKGAQLAEIMHDLTKQSAKMVYVGFSRATHLLCFAVHEKRFAALESTFDGSVWDVIKLAGTTPELEQAA